ncbi:MAG: carboxypeptidase-like regulatory domain-containing protein [Bacteroidota bacterium]
MKSLSAFVILCLLFINSFGQGTLRGKITDETGETLIGVTVVFKANRSIGAVTDFDGNYSLKFTDATPQTIVISYISYADMEETFSIKNNEVLVKNFTMKPASKAIGEVEVTAKAVKSKEYYVAAIKRNSAVTLDFISSETMKKTGDANVTAAVARVSGVSTNSGFITVRGIGDRYIKTTINGSIIPTLDPFTNNIKLDIFPASLIDNVMITKTASPELPGDWAGAFLSVETKDYPDQLAINVETSFGYNAQSTFKDVISSNRSKTDWLGYDNDYRDFDHSKYIQAIPSPTVYQELVALGLGNYYNSMGVSGENWGEGTTTGETYFKLGLVQLGLLAPAMINDAAAYQAAKSAYESGSYKSEAFRILNAGVPSTGKALKDNWNTATRQGPVNFSQSFSIGNQFKLFGRDLGFIAGYKYGTALQYDPSSLAFRLRSDKIEGLTTSDSAIQQVSRETNGWSALINLSYKLSPNHSLGFMFMPNNTGVNNVRSMINVTEPNTNKITKSQFYEQRRQLIYQFKSDHYLPKSKIKIESHASYTRGKSTAPDFRDLQYWYDPLNNSYQIGGTIGNGVKRFYRYLTDNIFDSQLSAEMPIDNKPGIPRKIKIGGAYMNGKKKYDQYEYDVNFSPFAPVIQNDDLNAFFSPENFEITNGIQNGIPYSTIYQYYTNTTGPDNHTFGNTEIISGFGMIDYSINSFLRTSGGVRIEQADIYTDLVKFDSLNLPVDDIRRGYKDGEPAANPGSISELSILPSINFIYKIKNDESNPINLRLNYSKTVARPSVRELSEIKVFDYEYRASVRGNSKLKMVSIDNYDIRLESYFKSGDNISVSGYYKDFKNHIELVVAGGEITWQNVDKSYVVGVELEGKKVITKNFDFRANLTICKSQTEYATSRREVNGTTAIYIPLDTVKREMFGQAPYVVNAMFTYTSDSSGFTGTVSYNVQGPRLVLVSESKEVPNIYELPRHMIDVKLSKTLGKHFSVSLTVKDILNTSIRRTYKVDGEFKENNDYDNYTFGTNYILSLAYKL